MLQKRLHPATLPAIHQPCTGHTIQNFEILQLTASLSTQVPNYVLTLCGGLSAAFTLSSDTFLQKLDVAQTWTLQSHPMTSTHCEADFARNELCPHHAMQVNIL